MKSKKTLDSFVAYCEEHPQERFWQALRNWSGFPFIYIAWGSLEWEDIGGGVQDTFYWEGKDK